MRHRPLLLAVPIAGALLCTQAAQATPLAKILMGPAMKLVEWVSGLPSRKEVPLKELSTDETLAAVNEEMSREMENVDMESGARMLERFGFLPPDTNLKELYVDSMAHNAAAFYNPRTGTFYNVNRMGLLDAMNESIVVSHELTHAVQDQAIGAQAVFNGRREDDDRTRALQWVMEGQAIVVGNRAGNMLVGPAPGPMGYLWGDNATVSMWSNFFRKVTAKNMEETDKAAGFATPHFLVESMLSSYIDGSRFVYWVEKQLGKSAHTTLMCRLPQSTEQLMHPQKYLDRVDPPLRITMPDLDGRTIKAEGTVGEWGMEWLMRQHREFTQNQRPASGWGGDRIALYDDGSAVWRIAMDTEADAVRVNKLLAKVMEKVSPGAIMKLKGREVHIVTGPLAEQADGVSETLAAVPHAEFEADAAPPEGSVCLKQ